MTEYEKIESAVNRFAQSISEEVAEKRYYEIEEITAIAKTRLFFAISECIKIQVCELEEERRELVAQYNTPGIPHWKHAKLSKKLAEVSARLKDRNKVLAAKRQHDKFHVLQGFLKEKGLEEVLEEFYVEVDKQNL